MSLSTCSGKPSMLFWPLVWMKQRALCGRGLVLVTAMVRGDWYCWMDTLFMAPSYCWSPRCCPEAPLPMMPCCWWEWWTTACERNVYVCLLQLFDSGEKDRSNSIKPTQWSLFYFIHFIFYSNQKLFCVWLMNLRFILIWGEKYRAKNKPRGNLKPADLIALSVISFGHSAALFTQSISWDRNKLLTV